MTDDRISELSTELAVLHYVVHELMVAHCEREQNPVAFAQEFLLPFHRAIAESPDDEQWQSKFLERMQAFFGQVVSTLKSKTPHHDA